MIVVFARRLWQVPESQTSKLPCVAHTKKCFDYYLCWKTVVGEGRGTFIPLENCWIVGYWKKTGGFFTCSISNILGTYSQSIRNTTYSTVKYCLGRSRIIVYGTVLWIRSLVSRPIRLSAIMMAFAILFFYQLTRNLPFVWLCISNATCFIFSTYSFTSQHVVPHLTTTFGGEIVD